MTINLACIVTENIEIFHQEIVSDLCSLRYGEILMKKKGTGGYICTVQDRLYSIQNKSFKNIF